jgi:hypothetical protein
LDAFEIRCADLDREQRLFAWQVDSWEGAPIDYRLITTGRLTSRASTAP